MALLLCVVLIANIESDLVVLFDLTVFVDPENIFECIINLSKETRSLTEDVVSRFVMLGLGRISGLLLIHDADDTSSVV